MNDKLREAINPFIQPEKQAPNGECLQAFLLNLLEEKLHQRPKHETPTCEGYRVFQTGITKESFVSDC